MTTSRFVVFDVPTRLRAPVPVLALGVDTVPAVAWQVGREQRVLRPRWPVPLRAFLSAALPVLLDLRVPFGVIAYDPHPNFEVGLAAREWGERHWSGARITPVFHHAAHVANYGNSHGLRPFLGVAFDGTGFGEDGAVWGGEFFVVRQGRFNRKAHFRYVRLPGSEQAVREPWRMGFSAAYDALGPGLLKRRPRFLKGWSIGTLRLIETMVRRGVQSPWTSSVGRLFDATSAILEVAKSPSAEGEAARALERCASAWGPAVVPYPFEISREKKGLVIAPALLFRAILRDLEKGRPVPEIARIFHRTIAEIVAVVALCLRRSSGISDIYLAGGVFMNDILRKDTSQCLSSDGFKVVLASKPGTTDLGIATGQIAAVIMRGGQSQCV